jgi:hypothetical protein
MQLYFRSADSLSSIMYGAATSTGFIVAMVTTVVMITMSDSLTSAPDVTDTFECGLAYSDITSAVLIDLRVLIGIAILFDLEVWIILWLGADLLQSSLSMLVVLLIFLLYSSLELALLV